MVGSYLFLIYYYMKQKLLNWIHSVLYGYDPKIQGWLVGVAKEHGLKKDDYQSIVKAVSDEELSNFRYNFLRLNLLEGAPTPDMVLGGLEIYENKVLASQDKRAKSLLKLVENELEQRRKILKKQSVAFLDWDNLVIDEGSFKLFCKKSEFGSLGKARFDVSAQQDNGFPSHILTYSFSVKLGDEEIRLDAPNGFDRCNVCIPTNEEETKWLKKHRIIISFNPYKTEEPEPLFADDYYQQKIDVPLPLPDDTKQRIKDFLCGVEDKDDEKNQFENPKLIEPILFVLVYNHLLKRKLELDKVHVAEEIKRKHLKEKMYYRLMHQYSLCEERRKKLDELYRCYKTSK